MPLLILGEYDQWVKIRDKDGEVGWIGKNMISKTKTIITLGDEQLIYHRAWEGAYPVGRVQKNVTGKLLRCQGQRCHVKFKKITGWLDKRGIWGFSEKK
jgi:SH3-like domain-containing protein